MVCHPVAAGNSGLGGFLALPLVTDGSEVDQPRPGYFGSVPIALN